MRYAHRLNTSRCHTIGLGKAEEKLGTPEDTAEGLTEVGELKLASTMPLTNPQRRLQRLFYHFY